MLVCTSSMTAKPVLIVEDWSPGKAGNDITATGVRTKIDGGGAVLLKLMVCNPAVSNNSSNCDQTFYAMDVTSISTYVDSLSGNVSDIYKGKGFSYNVYIDLIGCVIDPDTGYKIRAVLGLTLMYPMNKTCTCLVPEGGSSIRGIGRLVVRKVAIRWLI